jgi:hypothetical protein
MNGMRENEIVTLERSQLRKAEDGMPQIWLPKTKTNRPRVIRLDGPILGEAVALLEAVPPYLNCRLRRSPSSIMASNPWPPDQRDRSWQQVKRSLPSASLHFP